MYTMVERRQNNPARLQETIERAHAEYFPKLQRAPGFVGFSLVPEEATGINTAIVVWESKAHADAFMPEVERWMRVLDEYGHTIQSDNRGETVIELQVQQ
ncbi:MAG: hypothetical protein ABI369_10820 [Acetobacteraceae bacterium]